MTERPANVRGIPIHYQELGGGTPVIAIHGLSRNHHMEMAALEPIFSARTDVHGWLLVNEWLDRVMEYIGLGRHDSR